MIIIIQESNKPMKILLALNMKGIGRWMKRGRVGLGGVTYNPREQSKENQPYLLESLVPKPNKDA